MIVIGRTEYPTQIHLVLVDVTKDACPVCDADGCEHCTWTGIRVPVWPAPRTWTEE